ncbi:enoyl-CoA hydratase-related protein [Streptomyces sp. NPDC005803]|uniref:enoyl-CoA hydratase-related protein n=1 Tax=Streptomyces sp. NPDC005803 TaxID=3154297 RepID=UPI0033FF4F0C
MVLTLNRPDHHNAWTLDRELLYTELFDRTEAEREVRAVVLTGAGRSFCPGKDTGVLDAASSGARPWPTDRLPPRARPLMCPKWVSRPSTGPGRGSV